MDLVGRSRPARGEEAPISKRMRLPHSSGGGDNNTKNKACIILYCLGPRSPLEGGRDVFRIEYNIFIIDDLKSAVPGPADDFGYTYVSPTLQIDCGLSEIPVTDAFCVLGEKLYMFEGCVDVVRKSVFAFDLTQTKALTRGETRKLKKGEPLLKKIADMTFPKKAPVALPTPDGKNIVVFPTDDFLTDDDDDDDLNRCCVFEMFQPESGSWEQLPSIMGCCSEFIQAYGFMQDSNKLLVQIRFAGMYFLDLDEPVNKRWVELNIIYEDVERIPHLSFCPSFFEIVGESGRYCFVNEAGFYDLEEFVGKYDREDVDLHGFDIPPELVSIPRLLDFGRTKLDSRVAHLNYDGERGECHFCRLRLARPPHYVHVCSLSVTVCRVDLKSYKEMAQQLSLEERRSSDQLKYEKTTTVKTHKFALRFLDMVQLYEPHLFVTF